MPRFIETSRGFPSNIIVSPQELNSRPNSLNTACGCLDDRTMPLAARDPRGSRGQILGVPNPGTVNTEAACNNGVFRGIVGRDKSTGMPLDNRKKVPDVTIAPYNMMVKFWRDITGPVAYFGSGAIIGRRHVLTAAHVVMDVLTGDVIKDEIRVTNYQDVDFELAQVYVNDDYQINIPHHLLNPAPLSRWTFARRDYALVVTTKDILPANTNFFKYEAASSGNWAKELTHLGFPANVPDEFLFPNYPCRDTSKERKDLFFWPGFGLCDGLLREQKLANSVVYAGSLGCVETLFDINRGHSGGPVFEKVGDEYRIYGIASITNPYCPNDPGRSYFHALYPTSVNYITQKKTESGV